MGTPSFSMTLEQAVGAVLRAHRRTGELSVAGLSQLSGVSAGTIGRIEAATRSATLTQLSQLSTALRLTVSEVLGEAEVKLSRPASESTAVSPPMGQAMRAAIQGWLDDPSTDPVLIAQQEALERTSGGRRPGDLDIVSNRQQRVVFDRIKAVRAANLRMALKDLHS